MFNIGDMVEFWLPDGKKYRYGKIARKDKTTCFIVSNMLKNKRIYRVKQKDLNAFRGEDYARTQNR
jgi:hypothetical protein